MTAPGSRGIDPRARARDVLVAGTALLVLFPVILAVAVAIRISLGSPVLFRHERPGLHGRPFTLFKFRTMLLPQQAGTTDDGARLTRLGAFLRATSLDEVPSLVNVLRGEMSLVGPRPLLTSYLDRYTAEQARRHHVLPGLTGWAQIHGRNNLPWEEKLALDVWYVDHRSPALDRTIISRTFALVARRAGISAQGHATAPEFQGSPSPHEA